jgi:hypothetical protein
VKALPLSINAGFRAVRLLSEQH